MTKKVGRKQFGAYPDEQAILEVIKLKARVRKGGKKPSYNSIAVSLNREGFRTQTGKLWRAQTVKNVLENLKTSPQAKPKPQKTKKTSLSTADYLTKQQLARVSQAARSISRDDEVIVAVLVGSGLRASEFIALQRRDLGIDTGQCQIDVRRGKGSKQRSVLIAAPLVEMLRSYVSGQKQGKKDLVFKNHYGRPLTYKTLYKRIKTIGKMAGIPDLHPHAFRHTFGTFLYHYKKDLFFVKEQLGHASIETTQIYAKTLTDSKIEQIDAMGQELAGLLGLQNNRENISKRETT